MAAALEEALGRPVTRHQTRDIVVRSLRAEIATALHISEYQVARELDLAYRLTTGYRNTLERFEAGEIAQQHARVITEEGVVIGTDPSPETTARREAYEQAVLEIAVEETPNRLRPIAKRLAEAQAESPIEERYAECRSHRRVTVTDAGDGMADLYAHLPAVEAYAIHDRLTRVARVGERAESTTNKASENAGEEPAGRAEEADLAPRTRDQRRADAFVEMLLGCDVFELEAGSAAEAIRARVQIVVPEAVLCENEDEDAGSKGLTAELSGYGPVDAASAREIAGRASSWERVSTSSAGMVLSVERYRPSEEMKRLLVARDQRCRFPGCRVPVNRCDIDHTIDAAHGGPTATDNLAHLCRGHHTLKHHGGWRVEQLREGTLKWTSPSGRHHIDRPPRMPGVLEIPTDGGSPSPRPPSEQRHRVRFEESVSF